ncbi:MULTISPECIES: hypothetical protein [unclassified Streptomyces]|uniref:hypothetical protein n=1 Tax=unclassified Streptomyces TaxID=2593676 RepID=UPI002E1179A0|nr:hypothetical protein OG452_34255 [Streptomyces sp. NBC_01197]WSS47274.1 hypothetical protein OG708_00575 [Streptomyces sp. NBC_01180]
MDDAGAPPVLRQEIPKTRQRWMVRGLRPPGSAAEVTCPGVNGMRSDPLATLVK